MMALPILFAASLLGGCIFPWWWPAVAGYAVGFWLPRRGGAAFASGFAGTGLAWAAAAAFLDWRNHQILSGRIAMLFHLPSGLLLPALTGVLGGIVGGLAAWAGFALRAYVKPRPLSADTAAGEAAAGASAAAETPIS
ncbi:MAG TPA: hypothetical protein VJ385_09885 [Fibrobacteria bacterium]|nr:hypothetical protein [Fibrobacteria bacterium]